MQSYRIYVIVAGRNMRPLFYWGWKGTKMSRTEAIKDFSGKILYYLEYKDNGDIVRKSFSGKIEEIYNARSNKTQDFSGKILAQGNAIGGTSNQPYPQRREDIKDFGGKILYTLEHKPNGDIVKKSFSGRIEGTYNASRNITQDFSGKILAQGNILGGTSQKDQAKTASNNTYKPTQHNYSPPVTKIEMLRPQNAFEAIFAQMLTPFYIMYKYLTAFLGWVGKTFPGAFTNKNLCKVTSNPAQSKMRKQFKIMLIVFISIAVIAIVIRIIQR